MAKHKRNNKPVIFQPHPVDYDGIPFLSIVTTSDYPDALCIIDNHDEHGFKLYMLDFALSGEDMMLLINLTHQWYDTKRDVLPLSIYLSAKGYDGAFERMYQMLDIVDVFRVIGFAPSFDMIGGKVVRGVRSPPRVSRKKKIEPVRKVFIRQQRKPDKYDRTNSELVSWSQMKLFTTR